MKKVAEFIRFGIVGVLAVAIHYGVYWVAKSAMPLSVAFTLGYVISFCVNFYLSNIFTFRTQANVKRGVGFAISHLINYFIQLGLFELYISVGVDDRIAPFCVFLISVPINFVMVRFALKNKKL